jgi:hypothetical protein
MTSQTGHPISRRSALAGLSAGGIGLALANSARSTAAQDATTPAGMAPIVGMWQWNSSPDRPEPQTFALFQSDGTYLEWNPVAGVAIGIWRQTGDLTYDLLFIFPDTDPTFENWGPGTATFTITLEMDESGNALNAEGTIDVRDAGGVTVTTVPFNRPATRVTFDVNPSTGSIPATPVNGTPTG